MPGPFPALKRLQEQAWDLGTGAPACNISALPMGQGGGVWPRRLEPQSCFPGAEATAELWQAPQKPCNVPAWGRRGKESAGQVYMSMEMTRAALHDLKYNPCVCRQL